MLLIVYFEASDRINKEFVGERAGGKDYMRSIMYKLYDLSFIFVFIEIKRAH